MEKSFEKVYMYIYVYIYIYISPSYVYIYESLVHLKPTHYKSTTLQ